MTTLSSLHEDLLQVLEDEKQEILEDTYPEDRLHQIVDGMIPVYYSQLAECLNDNYTLAEVEDEGLLPEKADVWKIIQVSLYEQLSHVAFEWLYEQEEDSE